jgi:hypothetical protein
MNSRTSEGLGIKRTIDASSLEEHEKAELVKLRSEAGKKLDELITQDSRDEAEALWRAQVARFWRSDTVDPIATASHRAATCVARGHGQRSNGTACVWPR